MNAYIRLLGALQEHGCRPIVRGDRARASCPNPGHGRGRGDKRASLSIRYDGRGVGLKCFGRCRTEDVLGALGRTYADLFDGPPSKSVPREIVAVYSYTDVHGVLIAEKVRYFPKQFRWRVEDARRPGGWRWKLGDAKPSLYNLANLPNAHRVLVTEGERAVEVLSSIGFAATCGTAGASLWRDEWSRLLWTLGAHEIVVLADHDEAGRQHAVDVATTCRATESDAVFVREPRVAIIRFADLPHAADVVDYLEAGHDATDLSALIAAAPAWFPNDDERERAEHRRQQATVRQRRHRERLRAGRQAVTLRMSECHAAYVQHPSRCHARVCTSVQNGSHEI